jgi:hypothetical protein
MYPVLPWKHNAAFNLHFWTARVAVNERNKRCHYKAANMVTVLWHLPSFCSSNALVSRYTLFLPYFQNIHTCHKWFSSLKMVLNLHFIYIYIYIKRLYLMENSQAIQNSLGDLCNRSLHCALWGLNSVFTCMSLLSVPFHIPFVVVPICIPLYLSLGYINIIKYLECALIHCSFQSPTLHNTQKWSQCYLKLPLPFMSMETAWEWHDTSKKIALLRLIIVYTCYVAVSKDI